MWCALIGDHGHRVRIAACNPMVCPNWGFRRGPAPLQERFPLEEVRAVPACPASAQEYGNFDITFDPRYTHHQLCATLHTPCGVLYFGWPWSSDADWGLQSVAIRCCVEIGASGINGVELTDNGARTAKTAFGSIGALLTEHEQVTLKQWEAPEEAPPPESKRRSSGVDAPKRGVSSDHTAAGAVGSRKAVRATALKDRPVPMAELQAFARDTTSNLAAEAAALVDRRRQVDMMWDACAAGIVTEGLADQVALPAALR